VIRASDGKRPRFFGSGSAVHTRVREKMLEILNCDTVYDVLNQQCLSEISRMRKDFAIYQIQDIKIDRPFLCAKKNLQFYTFTSTKINHTIDLLLDLLEIESSLDDKRSMFEFELSRQNFLKNWNSISKQLINLDSYLDRLLDKNLHIISFSKWGVYLPKKFQIKLIKDKILDIPGTELFLNSIRLVGDIKFTE
jgi:ATP-dependent helicase Lhr and Lhr-like helicase